MYDDLNPEDGAASPKKGEAAPAVNEDTVLTVVEDAPPAEGVAPTPEANEQAAGGQDEETYEHRFRSLQGIHAADIARFTAQNNDLTERLVQMEQLVATMQNAPAPVAPVVELAPESSLTPEEVEEYGESIDIMRKVSQEVAGAYQGEIDSLKETIQQLQGNVLPRVEQLSNQQAQNTEQKFWSDLVGEVPNWQEINTTQAFQDWLLEVDPLSGLTRQTYLDDAQRNMDAARVASFFTSWNKVTGTETAQSNRTDTTSELEKQVAPGKGRSSGAPTGGEQKTYTPQDITDFFADVRMGKFKGDEKRRDTIERDIFAAQQDGRIVNA